MIPRNQRGLTLTELTVVMAIAAIVMIGIVTFYINSQGTWLDASSQALTQRDATLLLERMTAETRRAHSADVVSIPDATHEQLLLYDTSGEHCRFYWSPSDSLVHFKDATTDGPVTTSRVLRFELGTDHSSLVYLRALTMQSSTDQPVELASTMALYNR
jgi:prepilin-type N-terminal cleavage/methylation domain-containing protein